MAAPSPRTTLIVGAAGAVGKRLVNALVARGVPVIASDRMQQLPPSIRRVAKASVGGVDVRDPASLTKLFAEHADEDTVVWNLAAPLSVDTALDPALAEAVTIGGMENVINAMTQVGARRICFTDSIGSFGSEAPRTDATARWLIDNPTQDPGSDYGRQKRGCRDLMTRFAQSHGGDSRFAILPGVLHSEAIWGNGTTEYALDALLAAARGESFVCPVHPDVTLPMVFTDDLMRGLIALQEADEAELSEPQRGYCLPGLSFSPTELFDEIRKHVPGFEVHVELNENMNKFAHLWPDTLNMSEPLRDLGYAPSFGLQEMVATVLGAHAQRHAAIGAEFARMSKSDGGALERSDLDRYLRGYTRKYRYVKRAGGRERYGHISRRPDVINRLIDLAMAEMDHDNDGRIELPAYLEWTRRHTLEGMTDEYLNKNWKAITAKGQGSSSQTQAAMKDVQQQLGELQLSQAKMLSTQEKLLAEIALLREELVASRKASS